VCRDIQRILGAELEPSFDRPGFVQVAAQLVDRLARVGLELFDRSRERREG
jgi:hypothetical protein